MGLHYTDANKGRHCWLPLSHRAKQEVTLYCLYSGTDVLIQLNL
jgi:hypothetical protein